MPELDDRRPFTRADAVAAGVGPKVLRTSRFRRLFRDVYVGSRRADDVTRAAAALALQPATAFISHHTAAQLWGLPVPHSAEVHVTVLRPEDRHFRRGIRCHVTTETSPDVELRHGLRVCHPLRMFVHLAGRLDLVDMVVLGDAMVRVLHIPPAEIVAYCRQSDRHHAKRALRAAGYVRAGVDSPMESRLRMLLVLAGLPEPVVNHRVYDRNGTLVRRYDLSYPVIRLIIEYDGRQHAESEEQWDRDVERREDIDDDGWRILVIRAKDVYRQPARTIQRVHRQLQRRGWPGAIRLRDDWREHFPAR